VLGAATTPAAEDKALLVLIAACGLVLADLINGHAGGDRVADRYCGSD
jgi:hypothetical protein